MNVPHNGFETTLNDDGSWIEARVCLFENRKQSKFSGDFVEGWVELGRFGLQVPGFEVVLDGVVFSRHGFGHWREVVGLFSLHDSELRPGGQAHHRRIGHGGHRHVGRRDDVSSHGFPEEDELLVGLEELRLGIQELLRD